LPLPGLHAEQVALEPRQQAAVAHGEIHRLRTEVGVHLGAVLQRERKIQEDARAFPDA
jgi:hypothetical protein